MTGPPQPATVIEKTAEVVGVCLNAGWLRSARLTSLPRLTSDAFHQHHAAAWSNPRAIAPTNRWPTAGKLVAEMPEFTSSCISVGACIRSAFEDGRITRDNTEGGRKVAGL